MAVVQADRLDISKPLWNLDTFWGRVQHFFWVTDPRTCIVSDGTLDAAKTLLQQYREKIEPPGTTKEQVIYAKQLYESAFHPDTGEKQNVFGRMSFQVPGGMAITGAMLQWYRTLPAVIFWQWVNQSFNALVNYTNRNANSPTTTTQLAVAYVSATGSALITAVGCKSYWQKRASPIMQRYVPFAAVAASNCVNIPLMRQNEILNGIEVSDKEGNKLTESRVAAVKGITQVALSRIIMCAPGMTILPVVMERLETYPWMQKIRPLHGPMQVMMVGCLLAISKLTCTQQSSQKFVTNASPLLFKATDCLFGEPLKKKRRLDPAIIKAREERRKRKIEKEIRRLMKHAKQLKPIEEVEVPFVLEDQKVQRTRNLDPYSKEEEEKNALLEKEWCRYKQKEFLKLYQNIDRVLYSQQQALDELRLESEELYQAAIQIDPTLLPFKESGPKRTPPIKDYDPPDGEYQDVSKVW